MPRVLQSVEVLSTTENGTNRINTITISAGRDVLRRAEARRSAITRDAQQPGCCARLIDDYRPPAATIASPRGKHATAFQHARACRAAIKSSRCDAAYEPCCAATRPVRRAARNGAAIYNQRCDVYAQLRCASVMPCSAAYARAAAKGSRRVAR